MEVRASEIMGEAGAFACKKILAEDTGHFKLSQACIGNIFYFYFQHLLSAFFLIFILFADIQFDTEGWRIKFNLLLSAAYAIGCRMCLQVRNRQATVELWSSGQCTAASQANDCSTHLTHVQRLAVKHAVRVCPLQLGACIVDKSAGFSPGKKTEYSRSSQR
jgi:hypothetical protein